MASDLSGTRILVLMPSIPLHGMERANLQIMKMMRERGAEVTFVTEATYGGAVRAEVERIGGRSVAISNEGGLHVPRTPFELSDLTRRVVIAARLFRRIQSTFRPTHVHVPNFAFFLLWFPELVRTSARVVFRLPNPPDRSLSGWRRSLSDWLWRRCVGRIPDVIVCNSRYTQEQLFRLGLDRRRIRVIHNCVAERPGAKESDAPAADLKRFRAAYVGQIRREKGVAELYTAARKLVAERDDVDFWFAGENQWKNPFAADLIREVEREALSQRIRFLGYVDDVPGLLRRCDVHVCPSTSDADSLPNVILEAKQAGKPSIVFPTAGLPEAVVHGVDGYVCAERTAAALETGIRHFLDQPGNLARAGRAASDSLQKFSRQACSDLWAEVFLPPSPSE